MPRTGETEKELGYWISGSSNILLDHCHLLVKRTWKANGKEVREADSQLQVFSAEERTYVDTWSQCTNYGGRNIIFNIIPPTWWHSAEHERYDEMDIISAVKKFSVLYANNNYHYYCCSLSFTTHWYSLSTTYILETKISYSNIFPHLTLWIQFIIIPILQKIKLRL